MTLCSMLFTKKNKASIRWLKWMGVKFINKKIINKETFYEFIYV